MAGKNEIRENIIRKRNEIPDSDWQEKTNQITRAVSTHPWFREAFELYCYVDFNGEVGTRAIIEEAWRLGKLVAVPKVTGSRINFFYINSFHELAPGTFQVPEPIRPDSEAPGKDALVLMPGVAFDRRRHRVGYGKGYYDKYLYSHASLPTMAIGFDMQILEDVPVGHYDINPQVLITESEVIE